MKHFFSSLNFKWGKTPGVLFLIIILFSVSILFLGYFYYSNQVKVIKEQKQSELTSISKLKINQILRWKKERLGDAAIIYNNQDLIKNIANWFNNKSSLEERKNISLWENTLKTTYEYYNIIYFDKDYKQHLRPGEKKSDYSQVLEMGKKAIQSKNMIFSDFLIQENENIIHLDLIIPIYLKNDKDISNVGFLVLQIDPQLYLYDLIQSWPTNSKTSETLLIRKEGDSVLFLNKLRFKEDAALNFKIPLDKQEIPAVQGGLGYEGIFEGVDYRNVKTLSYIKRIDGTTWIMIAKVDRDEIYEPIKEKALQTGLITVILVLLVAVGIYALWKSQKLENLNKLRAAELERLALTKHYEYLVNYANDIILLADENLNIVEANERAIQHYGYSKEELLNKSFWDIRSPEERALLLSHIEQVEAAGGQIFETIHIKKDGIKFPAEINLHVISIEGKKYFQDIIRDITERKAALFALEQSEKHFHSLFENMLNGYAYCKMIFNDNNDPQDFIYLDANKSFERLTGLKEVKGKKVSEVIPGIRQTDPGLFERYGRVSLSGIPEVFEINVEALNMWFSISVYSPLKEYFVAVFDVITERKNADIALRASEALYHSLVENIPASIFRKNREGCYEFVNSRFCQLKDLKEDEIIGKTPIELSEYEAAKEAGGKFQSESGLRQQTIVHGSEHHELIMKTGQHIELEEVYPQPDGTIKYYHVIKAPIISHAGEIIGSQGIQFDVTDRKMAQREIEKLNSELEDRIKQRTIQLETSNKELEAFSYSVSHDLRAPLRALDGFAKILLEDYSHKLDAEGQRLCNIIISNAKKMGQLIDDLLAFSRIGRQGISQSSIDMNAIVNEVFQELITDKIKDQIEFTVQPLPESYGDLSMMRQVWRNLIGNAIKFSSTRSKSIIEVGALSYDDEKNIVYYVRDNGVGFNMQYADKLFGVFQRLHRVNEFEGTGVGLAIVQRIIHRHGGQIWAESEENKGATFYFNINRLRSES